MRGSPPPESTRHHEDGPSVTVSFNETTETYPVTLQIDDTVKALTAKEALVISGKLRLFASAKPAKQRHADPVGGV